MENVIQINTGAMNSIAVRLGCTAIVRFNGRTVEYHDVVEADKVACRMEMDIHNGEDIDVEEAVVLRQLGAFEEYNDFNFIKTLRYEVIGRRVGNNLWEVDEQRLLTEFL